MTNFREAELKSNEQTNQRTENPHFPGGLGTDKTQKGGRWHFEHECLCLQDGTGWNLYQARPEGCAPSYCHAPTI